MTTRPRRSPRRNSIWDRLSRSRRIATVGLSETGLAFFSGSGRRHPRVAPRSRAWCVQALAVPDSDEPPITDDPHYLALTTPLSRSMMQTSGKLTLGSVAGLAVLSPTGDVSWESGASTHQPDVFIRVSELWREWLCCCCLLPVQDHQVPRRGSRNYLGSIPKCPHAECDGKRRDHTSSHSADPCAFFRSSGVRLDWGLGTLQQLVRDFGWHTRLYPQQRSSSRHCLRAIESETISDG